MSVKIKINWDNENVVSESVRIYRADSAFTSTSLPPLLTEIIGDVYEYGDTTVIDGNTYFYMLSAKLGEQEIFTECFDVSATIERSYFPLDKNVLSIIVADSPVFPSSELVDKKGVAVFNTSNRPTQVQKAEFLTGGAFECNTNDENVGVTSSSYVFNYQDFVVECEVLLSESAVSASFGYQIINIGSQYGIPGRSVFISIVHGVVHFGTRPTSSTGYASEYSTSYTVSANRKYHFAIMRKQGIFYVFVDGHLIYTRTEEINLSVNAVQFGRYAGTNLRFINSIRITKEAFYPEANSFIVDISYVN